MKKSKELPVLSLMKQSVKNDLGIATDAIELSSSQILAIVDKIVDVK